MDQRSLSLLGQWRNLIGMDTESIVTDLDDGRGWSISSYNNLDLWFREVVVVEHLRRA